MTRFVIGFGAAALLGMVLAAPAPAAPETPDFTAAWIQAKHSFEGPPFSSEMPAIEDWYTGEGDFAKAQRQLAPLTAVGTALDDVQRRAIFNHDAALIYCMAGLRNEAVTFARLVPSPYGADVLGNQQASEQLAEDAREVVRGNPNLNWLGSGRFEVDGPWLPPRTPLLTTDRINTWRYNSRLPLSRGLGWVPNLNEACAVGVSGSEVGPRMTLSRSPTVTLRCTWVVTCVGIVKLRVYSRPLNNDLTGDDPRPAVKTVLAATARYAIASGQRHRVRLKVTLTGQKLIRGTRRNYDGGVAIFGPRGLKAVGGKPVKIRIVRSNR
jgi:hypothetical protein